MENDYSLDEIKIEDKKDIFGNDEWPSNLTIII